MIEYLGTFHFTGNDNYTRAYHLWAVIDDEGDICAIHYGISLDLQMASGEVIRKNCDSALRRKAFTIAEERWEAERIEDEPMLIDEEDNFNIGGGACH